MTGAPLLVTGFGPFPGMPDNPSQAIVHRVAARGLPGVSARVLPTEWAVCDWLAEAARPATTVLMFGVAGRAERIRYERVSRPRAVARHDAAGRLPDRAPPRSRRTTVDVAALVRQARRNGFPVALSDDAGAYICNASYGAALSAVPHGLFVHVPQARPSGALSLDGLEAHALWLIARLGEGVSPRQQPVRRGRRARVSR
jgi:pyroglutamyl-peptidase